MIERLLENWLDSLDERLLQFAFCQMLIDDGHTILHCSRHAPIEHGKDIISLDSNGLLNAFQLKAVAGKKLSKKHVSELTNQLNELVTAKIEHPSIKKAQWHKSYLVVNGELEEEASDFLTKFNEGWIAKGISQHQVTTIVRGELLERAKSISGRLFPAELGLFRLLLELYLNKGNGMLSKDKFAELLLGSLPMLGKDVSQSSPLNNIRSVSAAALINAVALASFSSKANHFAEIEAWVLYLGHVAAISERFDWTDSRWVNSVTIVEAHVFYLLERLVEETSQNPAAIEGDPLTDQICYRPRVTLLCGLLSIYALWRKLNAEAVESKDHDEFIRGFVCDNKKNLFLWGEAAIPQFMALHWYLRTIDATPAPDFMLAGLLEGICKMNAPKSQQALPNPYYDVEAVLLHQTGAPSEYIKDTFTEHAYTTEALMHLFVRRNWKQYTKLIWPAYTRLMVCTLEVNQRWMKYLWRIEDQGVNQSKWPVLTKEWSELKNEAMESAGLGIPDLMKQKPMLFLLFLIIYPHRCDAESVRWLDSTLSLAIYNAN